MLAFLKALTDETLLTLPRFSDSVEGAGREKMSACVAWGRPPAPLARAFRGVRFQTSAFKARVSMARVFHGA